MDTRIACETAVRRATMSWSTKKKDRPLPPRFRVPVAGKARWRHVLQFPVPKFQVRRQIAVERLPLRQRVLGIGQDRLESRYSSALEGVMRGMDFLEQYLGRPGVGKEAMGKKTQCHIPVFVAEGVAAKSVLGIEVHGALRESADGGFLAGADIGKLALQDIRHFEAPGPPILGKLDGAAAPHGQAGAQGFMPPTTVATASCNRADIAGLPHRNEHGIGERHVGGKPVHAPELLGPGRKRGRRRFQADQTQHIPGPILDGATQN